MIAAIHYALSFPADVLIGVGRFRILGGGGKFRILGVTKGGQIPSRHMTSMRRNVVASTSFRRHVPTRFLSTSFRRHVPIRFLTKS